MKHSNMLTWLLACLLSMQVGCASTKQYDGPQRPSSKLAILTIHGGGYISEIDGKWRGIGNIKRYDFLPGEHTLKVYYWPDGFRYKPTDAMILSVTFEPGRMYDLLFTEDTSERAWRAVVEDTKSEEVVSRQLRPPNGESIRNY